MIGKKNEGMLAGSAPTDMKAILDRGSEFEGKLRFEGTVRINGKFRGEIHSEGTLIIGDQAAIDGDIEVDTAIISGELRGNVKARSRVELHAPAKLFGNLQSPVLVIQEGVVFDGNCQMTKEKKAETAAGKTAAASAASAAADSKAG